MGDAGAAPIGSSDEYAGRILDAAYTLVGRHGLRRTSIADIVRESGVSRATLFRRFPSRAALLNSLMTREVTRFLDDLDQRLEAIADPLDRLVEIFVRFVEVVRGHEVLRNLIDTDPETVLPLLTVDAEPLLAFGQNFMTAELLRLTDTGYELTAPPEVCTELLTRLSHSYLILPASAIPLEDLAGFRRLARATLLRMVVETGPH